jgi:hypothetical protein
LRFLYSSTERSWATAADGYGVRIRPEFRPRLGRRQRL